MSNYKKQIIFDEDEKAQDPIRLSAQKRFDDNARFSPALTKDEHKAEQEMVSILSPKRKHRGFLSLLCAGMGLAAWQSVDNIITAIETQDWLSLGWSGFVAGIAAVGFSAIVRELYALKKLKGREDTKVKLQRILDSDGIGKAKGECEKLAKLSQTELSAGFDKWQHSLAATHNDKEVFELYDSLVLQEQDKQVKTIVARQAMENAVMVAISPLAVVDMILVAWRSIYLIDKIAQSYGVSLGYWSRIRLLRLALTNMAFAGVSEVVADASVDLLSLSVAGTLSTRAAQGLGIGLLTARLGFKAINLMRPLPHLSTTAPKLSDIRQELLNNLSSA